MQSKMLQPLVGVVLIANLGLTAPALAGGYDPGPVEWPARISQMIVRLQASDDLDGATLTRAQLARLRDVSGVGLRLRRPMSGGAWVLALPESVPVEEAHRIAARLERLDEVLIAEPDRIFYPMLFAPQVDAPSDPLFSEQWHYTDPVAGIGLLAAWEVTTGSPDVQVAVLDTGILGSHEDLEGQWSGGYDFISSTFSARDGDGRDPDPSDEGDRLLFNSSSWHGSHVGGTIAAGTDNGLGVAGIAPDSILQPIRTLGSLGGTTSDIVDAMRWASGLPVPGLDDNPNPAQVLNLSLGGSGTCSATWQDAIDDVVGAGTTVVVAAGNSSANAADFTPASCDNLISVGATGPTADIAYYSNFGPSVDLSAPGGDAQLGGLVLSTIDSGNRVPEGAAYAGYQGTSMAAPHVAGVVALMLSVDPTLTPAQIEAILKANVRAFPSGSNCALTSMLCGAGLLDAAAAVNAVAP